MRESRSSFWRYAFAVRGSVLPRILPRVLVFGAWALAVAGLYRLEARIAIKIAPIEAAGVVLGLLLVLRTNAGYDRWWEARKIWGGIVNQSRNMVMAAGAYGPADPAWRDAFVRWAAAFAHVARGSLRAEQAMPEVTALLGEQEAARVSTARHRPLHVGARLTDLLREACDVHGMDRFAFLQIDGERARLIDHLGACERILKTPLPSVYAIKVRRLIAIYLFLLPFAIVEGTEWLTPFAAMFAAYPILALDQISLELQNPFSKDHLSHLPLDELTTTIEADLLDLAGTGHGPRATLDDHGGAGRG